jgi:tRNA uridine 5-carboxymethylaminomethyl modification enzyme
LQIPTDLDYGALRGLSNEVVQTLETARPRTLGQASRIDGITPAALTLVLAHLHRRRASSKARAG